MISDSHRFIFVHIPRTGGNSIQSVLVNYSEDEIICLHPHDDGVNIFQTKNKWGVGKKHMQIQEYRRRMSAKDFRTYFKFCCVRNPWEKEISQYFAPHRGIVKWDTNDFVSFVTNRPSYFDFITIKGKIAVDYIMRFENLQEDFNRIADKIGIPKQELPHRNKSKRDDYTKYYDATSKYVVAQKYAKEIHYFKYRFEGRSCQTSGV